MESEICGGSEIINRVTETFGKIDYIIFAFLLLLSAVIGIYFAWTDREKGADDYMMGGGTVGPFPIAASLGQGGYYLYRSDSRTVQNISTKKCVTRGFTSVFSRIFRKFDKKIAKCNSPEITTVLDITCRIFG